MPASVVPKLIGLMNAKPSRRIEQIKIFNGELSEGRVPLPQGLAAARAIVAIAPRTEAALTAHGNILDRGRSDERVRSLIALRGFEKVPAPLLRQIVAASNNVSTPRCGAKRC